MEKIEFTKEWLRGNKVAIRCENKSEANSVFLLFKGHDCNWTPEDTCFAVEDGCGAIFFREVDCESDGLSIVSYSEFVQDTRKIIGYRCPFDMYQQDNNWRINKGDLYIKTHEFLNCYRPQKNQASDLFAMPDEIVEQWEPVYEDVRPCFSSCDEIISHFKDSIVTVHGRIHIEQTIHSKNGTMVECFYVTKKDYSFTPEFEQKLKDMGINI